LNFWLTTILEPITQVSVELKRWVKDLIWQYLMILVSDEDARSATVIASIEDTVYKAIDYALHPTRRKVIWSGTPFNAKDPLYKAVESGAFHVNVYPVCEEFPVAKEDFRGSWEDRFTYEYVLNMYNKALKAGKIYTFNQEMMLRIMSEEDRLVQDNDIKWFSLEVLKKNKEAFNYYITTDFATSERQSADYSVISVWGLNNIGSWHWVDGIVKRQTMDKNIDCLFKLANKWKPQSVGIEISGQQGGFISWIEKEMMNRNINFVLASENNKNQPGIRPTTQKMVRFNVVLPWFKLGKIKYPEELKDDPRIVEHMNEIKLISANGFRSKHDDCIDTITMLGSLVVWEPSEELDDEDEMENWWDDDNPNIRTGAFASYIV